MTKSKIIPIQILQDKTVLINRCVATACEDIQTMIRSLLDRYSLDSLRMANQSTFRNTSIIYFFFLRLFEYRPGEFHIRSLLAHW